MPRIILRLLLALCLVLNGIGTAMAAVTMPAMQGGSIHAAMSMPQPESQPASAACGHAAGDGAEAAPVDFSVPSTPHPADCGQDCCAQGACSCPCMHLVQAALLESPALSTPPGHTCMATALPVGHTTPALLDLIRPPIG